MGKNSPDEINKNTDFFKYMYGMRTEIDWMYEFIRLLEGQSIDKKNDQSHDFAISYVIIFLQKYCDNYDDYEFVLAVYGFLKGFEYDRYKSGQRIMTYWEYASKYRTHRFIKKWDRDSVSPSLRLQHQRIIGYLDKKIEKMKSVEIKSKKIKSGDDYRLGLIDEVPKELKFPEPRKIEDITSTSEDSDISQKISENKTESDQQVPEHEIEPGNEALGDSQSDLQDNPEKGIGIEPEEIQIKPPVGLIPSMELNEDKLSSYMRLAVTALFSIAAILAFALIIKPWWMEKANAREATAAPVAPAENLSPAKDIPVDNALLVEMETFSIDEDDKVIPLAPGYSKELPIKDISPPNADIGTLEVQSSDESIVWEKDGYLTASDDIPVGESLDIYITITAKNHREIICVQVENPEIPDDAEGAVGGGRQSGY